MDQNLEPLTPSCLGFAWNFKLWGLFQEGIYGITVLRRTKGFITISSYQVIESLQLKPKETHIFRLLKIHFNNLNKRERPKHPTIGCFAMLQTDLYFLLVLQSKMISGIQVDCLHKGLRIGRHQLVTPAVCYGVVSIAASNYWMFLYPIVDIWLRMITY